MLESKIEIRSRGLPSPDEGDALALTFAAGSDRYAQERLRRNEAGIRAAARDAAHVGGLIPGKLVTWIQCKRRMVPAVGL